MSSRKKSAKNAHPPKQPRSHWLTLYRAEVAFVVIASAALVYLHLLLQAHAGAFWRDEISSILLSRSPTWKGVWNGLITDSFPVLWVTLLRIWNTLGMGAGDWWQRSLCMVFSLGMFTSLLFAARRFKSGVPVVSFALLGGIPAMFYWGDSLRAYTLACLLVILLYGWVWSYLGSGSGRDALAGALFAVLSAQSNYQNSYLILGICVAGATVAAIKGLWKRAAVVLGMGAAAAASLLPYYKVITTYQAGGIIQKALKITPDLIWQRFTDGYEGVLWTVLPFLCILTLLVLASPLLYLIKPLRSSSADGLERQIFPAVCVLVCLAGGCGFILVQGFTTNCWYYLPIVAVIAVSAELALSAYQTIRPLRAIFLVLACAAFIAALPVQWKQAHTRRTSMDLAADYLSKHATEGDFIMVYPFPYSVSFEFYYKGKAEWSLLPVVPEDQRRNCFDAILPLMTAPHPLDTTLDRLSKTLGGGGRIWIVGGLPALPAGATPPAWPGAPHPVYGWQNWAFSMIMALQVNDYLQRHATSGEAIRVGEGLTVCRFEDVGAIFVYRGWRSPEPSFLLK